MKKRESLKEATLRNYLRKEIQNILKEVEEDPNAEQGETEETEEVDESEVVVEKTTEFVRKLKGMDLDIDAEEMIEILSNIIDSWGFGSDTKLDILKGVKNKTIR